MPAKAQTRLRAVQLRFELILIHSRRLVAANAFQLIRNVVGNMQVRLFPPLLLFFGISTGGGVAVGRSCVIAVAVAVAVGMERPVEVAAVSNRSRGGGPSDTSAIGA